MSNLVRGRGVRQEDDREYVPNTVHPAVDLLLWRVARDARRNLTAPKLYSLRVMSCALGLGGTLRRKIPDLVENRSTKTSVNIFTDVNRLTDSATK